MNKRFSYALLILTLATIGLIAIAIQQQWFSKGYLYFNQPSDTPISNQDFGYFTPGGLTEATNKSNYSIVNLTQYGTFPNGDDIDNFLILSQDSHRIMINLSAYLFMEKPSNQLSKKITVGHQPYTKQFNPLAGKKVYTLIPKTERIDRIKRLSQRFEPFHAYIHSFLISDEPYLNGVNKAELEQLAQELRYSFKKTKLELTPLAVNFAGAMFHQEFATLVNQNLNRYVKQIDDYHQANKDTPTTEFENWLKTIKTQRLVSYDQAGNIYSEGGLPRGFDIFSFDFYLSTLLMDDMYHNSLQLLSNLTSTPACNHFNRNDVEQNSPFALSYINNGPFQPNIKADKQKLDRLFNCRMQSTLVLLTEAIKQLPKTNKQKHILLIAESSSNGFLERRFDFKIKQHQPRKLIEGRVYDEVKRYHHFFKNNTDTITAGIAYFLYPTSYDHSINQEISGVETLPDVLHLISSFHNEKQQKVDNKTMVVQ